MTRREVNPARAAFTLIELLVVIAIIAVLISLTAAAVMRVLVKGPELEIQHEIGEMSRAVNAFQTEFNAQYVPSQIKLRRNGPYNMSDPIEAATVNYLTQIFGSRINLNSMTQTFNWDGRGMPTSPVTLRGHHCLVFFLGGIPTPDGKGVTGFSTNPADPTAAGGTRRGPFFPFKSNRLVRDVSGSGSTFTDLNNGMLVYLDGFNKSPYLFFSSYKGGNYNPWAGAGSPDGPTGFAPYRVNNATPPRYHNHDTFQIISAGQDGQFGAGGLLDTATGSQDGQTMDNFTNFTKLRLGAGE